MSSADEDVSLTYTLSLTPHTTEGVVLDISPLLWTFGKDEVHELTVKVPNTSNQTKTPNTNIKVE